MTTTSEIALDKVRQSLQRCKVGPDDAILVAFSGGADSLALLLLLAQIRQVTALYVNHHLRPDQDLIAEEQLNQRNCEYLGVPLILHRLGNTAVRDCCALRGNGIEEAARTLRYEALEEHRRALGYQYIATAHSADDQSETLLMRILQGSALSAFQGIAEIKQRIIRPVLGLTRVQIEQVIREAGLSWSEDATNQDLQFLRNRVRHQIVGPIASVFPQYREALDTLAQQVQQVMKMLQPQAMQLMEESVKVIDTVVQVDFSILGRAPHAVIEQVIYAAWAKVQHSEGRRLSRKAVQQVYRAITEPLASGDTIFLPDTVLRREGLFLYWQKRPEVLAEQYLSSVYSPCVNLDGEHLLVIGETDAAAIPKQQRAVLDDATLVPPLVARSARSGDEIVLAEGTKRVHALYAGWHLDRSIWWRIPVLEDTNGIVAVLAGAFGGRDRVARRCLLPTLARTSGTLYSVTNKEG